MLLDTISQEMRFETRILPLRTAQQIFHTTTMDVQDILQLWNNMLTDNELDMSREARTFVNMGHIRVNKDERCAYSKHRS